MQDDGSCLGGKLCHLLSGGKKMIYVSVPKEIRDYEPKLIFGLSARQLAWGGIAIGLTFTVYFVGRIFIPINILSWIIMICAAVPFACGFISIQDMPADRYFLIVITFWLERGEKLMYNNGSDGGGLKNDISKEQKKRIKQIKKDREKIKKREFF